MSIEKFLQYIKWQSFNLHDSVEMMPFKWDQIAKKILGDKEDEVCVEAGTKKFNFIHKINENSTTDMICN